MFSYKCLIVIISSAYLRFQLLLLQLTSAWNKHCVAFSLDILFVPLGREGHPALTGMKLTVNLGAGPRQHLTGRQLEYKDYTMAFTE